MLCVTNLGTPDAKFRNAVTFHFTISHPHIHLNVPHAPQIFFIGRQILCFLILPRALFLDGGKRCPLLGRGLLLLTDELFVLMVLVVEVLSLLSSK